MFARVEIKQSAYELIEQDIPRIPSEEPRPTNPMYPDFQKETGIVTHLIQEAKESGDPNLFLLLAKRFSQYRTLFSSQPTKGEGAQARLTREFNNSSVFHILYFSTEALTAAQLSGTQFSLETFLRPLFVYFRLRNLPKITADVAQTYMDGNLEDIVEEEIEQKLENLLLLFTKIYLLKEQNKKLPNINPIPFHELITGGGKTPPLFILLLIRAYASHLKSLPELIPEGKVVLRNELYKAVDQFVKKVDYWAEQQTAQDEKLREALEKAAKEFNGVVEKTFEETFARPNLDKRKRVRP